MQERIKKALIAAHDEMLDAVRNDSMPTKRRTAYGDLMNEIKDILSDDADMDKPTKAPIYMCSKMVFDCGGTFLTKHGCSYYKQVN